MNQRILSLLVDNTAGVLTRIAGLFSRRGYNIDSITAGVTANPKYTRITIATSGDDLTLDQITNQVAKQVYVRDIKVLDPANSVNRELILVKIRATSSDLQDVLGITNVFRANIVDVGANSLPIEATGSPSKLSGLEELLASYGIKEITRTGKIAISRNSKEA